MLSLHPLPAFVDNYIWTLADDSGKAVVVDPGEAGPVLAASEKGLRPVAILLTHHHPDHAGGVAELQRRFRIPVYGPVDPRLTCVSVSVNDGDEVRVPELGLEFEVIAIPGHTLSHVAFHGGGILFCGDTLFSLGCGRLFEGTPAQMLSSLDRLTDLPSGTWVCCGHEYTQANGRFSREVEPDNPTRDQRLADVDALRAQNLPSLPSTLRSELDCNPFLRLDQPGVRASLLPRVHGAPDRVSAFAALRTWKDGFSA